MIWEANHTNPLVKPENLLQRYMPQLWHNMAVAGCELALLLADPVRDARRDQS